MCALAFLFLLCFCWVFVGSTGAGRGWRVEDLSDPWRGDTPSGLCDPAGILGPLDRRMILDMMKYMRRSTGPCPCPHCRTSSRQSLGPGYRASVVLVDKLDLEYPENSSPVDKNKSAEFFVESLRSKQWMTGSACGNDLIILVVTSAKQISTAIGEVTGQMLTKECAKTIASNYSHIFESKHYASGISQLIHEYTLVLQGRHPCKKARSQNIYIGVACLVIALFISFMAFALRRGSIAFCTNNEVQKNLRKSTGFHLLREISGEPIKTSTPSDSGLLFVSSTKEIYL